MLHFVTLEQEKAPLHGNVKIHTRALPAFERGNLYRVFAGKGYLQRREKGRKEFFVSLSTYFALMHGAHVPGDVLLSFARVAALRASDGLVVVMAQKVSLQCALVRELQPTRLAQMCATCMLFPHMQVESARAFKSTSAFVANDRSHVRVDAAVSPQIRRESGRVGTQGAAMHHSFLFHAAYKRLSGKTFVLLFFPSCSEMLPQTQSGVLQRYS